MLDASNPYLQREQYIFLLEFFIYYITGNRLVELNKKKFIPTTVSLQLLDLEDENGIVNITPVDPSFPATTGVGAFNKIPELFYTGRSILFAIPQKIVANKYTEFRIKLEAYKKIPGHNRLNIHVGTGELHLTDEFAALRKEILNSSPNDIPPPKSFEGRVQLYHDDNPIALAMVFARITGFGQSIVTEFESPRTNMLGSSSFIFKHNQTDDKSLAYKCRIVTQSDINVYNHPDTVDKDPTNLSMPNYCLPCGEENTAEVINEIIKPQGHYRTFQENNIEQNDENNIGIIQSSRGEKNQHYGSPIVLKVSGILMDEYGNVNKPTVTVGSDVNRARGHDIFVLRIGKKGIVGEGEKSDLQLEMRTPKGPIRRPPIRYETREIQTDVQKIEEILKKVEPTAKKSKKKKKKKKGKQKKKKKK